MTPPTRRSSGTTRATGRPAPRPSATPPPLPAEATAESEVFGRTGTRAAPASGSGPAAARRSAASTASARGAAAKSAAPARAGGGRRRAARRIGIMGGTFDPIHNGHLVAASEVASRFLLDEVVFVPTGRPWQKANYEVSPAEDRYLMTVIATASNPRFQVSRVDVDRDGPTYTVDTLRDLRAVYGPKVDMFFITGADALEKILSWKDAEQIFDLAHLVGVTRPGFVLSDEHLPADTVSLVQVPAMAISSTDCRRRVAEGQPVWYLVPDGVVQYIAKRQLYRPSG